MRPQRALLLLGLGLMAINRLAGLVLPASTKFLVDNVIGKRQIRLLAPLALAIIAPQLKAQLKGEALYHELRSPNLMQMQGESNIEWLPDGNGEHTRGQPPGRSHLGGGKPGAVHFDQGDVRRMIRANHLPSELPSIGERDLNRLSRFF